MSPRNILYDTEFLEDGNTIDLISIGMVCDDRTEYYAVNADCNFDRVVRHQWLWENVVPSLPTRDKQPPPDTLPHLFGVPMPIISPDEARTALGLPGALSKKQIRTELDRTSPFVKPKWVIANEVREFIICHYDVGDTPRLWANYSAFDHVALAWLYGPMCDLPKGVPMCTYDIQQLLGQLPGPHLAKMPKQGGGEHNALEDARYNRCMFDYAMDYLNSKGDA